jgi:two-component system alkaline phosphatase synthesis response regulator PhoP
VSPRIVLIEDEQEIVELVRYNLRKEGFEVHPFPRGSEALDYLRAHPSHLVLLDIMLPGPDGFEICKELRADERTRSLPVIFLTAKGQEADRVRGLEGGADDYVVKPFSPRELAARIKAVLRRQASSGAPQPVVTARDFRLDASTQEVIVRGRQVGLSALEFKLLQFLASNPRRVFSRERLIAAVWGHDHFATPRTVDVHIRHIREKIEAQPNKPAYIQTVRGSGYRFSPDAAAAGAEDETAHETR